MFRRSYVQKVLCSEGLCLEDVMFSSFYVHKVLYSVASMFKRSYVQNVLFQKVLCSEGPMLRISYVQKLICSECPLLKKEKLHKHRHRKLRRKARNDEQKANSTRKGDCMRSRGLRKSRSSARRSLGRREISGTIHGTKTQCKKGGGANHSAWHSAMMTQDTAQ